MKIETKYEIGQHIWIVYEHNGEVCVFDDEITEICVDKDGVGYWCKESGDSHSENQIILYKNQEELLNRIVNLMEDIRKREIEKKELGWNEC